MTNTEQSLTGERADILELLTAHRGFLRHTVQKLTDEQARLRPTKSELCLGGLIKHVTQVERGWADFIRNGRAFVAFDEAAFAKHAAGFQVEADETLEGLLTEYAKVAAETDEIVATLPDLDVSHELPSAPWQEPGKRWSARRVLLHIAAETAQHAGHADIIRETLDGQKTMG
ncbi:DinB family protein [Saccharopolyspora phatthalungensis]|uniref:Putative damage-inducible protein DinB n=1 Tax=Saccharopolyspora phatthalungensis TaxID=664693 RepID=A0A840Q278_9PSEU|nr:DinB family protein [Saccharopolyspora phatthalungensis]MBB5154534.1 putative damage-inducible protein DinB [Saccharopolyspora phatthalungensis]